MAEERAQYFDMCRTSNGGWIVHSRSGETGLIALCYAYSSDRDMLASLPSIIGHQERGIDDINAPVGSTSWTWLTEDDFDKACGRYSSNTFPSVQIKPSAED